MATFQNFDQFALDVAAGVHDFQTANSQLKVALSDTAPTVATDGVLADITQIAYTNITETMPADTTNVGAETPAGTWDVSGTDITLNATGNVAQFQYVILYNETPAGDPLISFWDYGSKVNLTDGDSFVINFGAQLFTLS